MAESPTISVIMPVWRPDPVFFIQAVESILRQSFTDFELLVIEDPSEISAGDLLGEIDDPRLRLVTSPTRTSMVDQLNRGIELSEADWLARMDADDIALPHRFESQLRALESSPEIDVLGTQIDVIDAMGHRIGKRVFPTSHEGIVDALRRFNPISHPSVMMRRSTVVEAGRYAYPERTAQDYELWSRLAVRGAVLANLPVSHLLYRLHGGSVKSRQVKDTLIAGIETKKEYWWDSMTWKDKARYALEKAALYAPSSWIYRLAQRRLYESEKVGNGTVGRKRGSGE